METPPEPVVVLSLAGLEFEADPVSDEPDVVDAQLELLVAKTLAEREERGEDFARERDHVVLRQGAL